MESTIINPETTVRGGYKISNLEPVSPEVDRK